MAAYPGSITAALREHVSRVQEYAEHERSREHVEAAYEKIVSQSFKARQKKGYRPGRGKRGDRVAFEIPPSRLQRLLSCVERGTTLASFARDYLVYIVLGIWNMMSFPLNSAPLLIMCGWAVFKLTRKRQIRNPEGPYFGESPVFGAVFQTALSLLAAFVIAQWVAPVLPWHEAGLIDVQGQQLLQALFLGLLNIFLK